MSIEIFIPEKKNGFDWCIKLASEKNIECFIPFSILVHYLVVTGYKKSNYGSSNFSNGYTVFRIFHQKLNFAELRRLNYVRTNVLT